MLTSAQYLDHNNWKNQKWVNTHQELGGGGGEDPGEK